MHWPSGLLGLLILFNKYFNVDHSVVSLNVPLTAQSYVSALKSMKATWLCIIGCIHQLRFTLRGPLCDLEMLMIHHKTFSKTSSMCRLLRALKQQCFNLSLQGKSPFHTFQSPFRLMPLERISLSPAFTK